VKLCDRLAGSRWPAHAQERMGNPTAGLQMLHDAEQRAPETASSCRGERFVLASTGRTDEAQAVASALEAIATERYLPPYAVGLVHSGLGDIDRALGWSARTQNALFI
jgi:hypothetical protein